ncbi:hypothetical protein BJ322DRAFT_1102895 [Thelephora terrestris]|uniref:TEA domain-containing protein n=1 Tax=Thelephora terrestris TaxID=56493 RepID=A0A9P6HQ42_9AGAM|nr:hypothetical protein BJ322DRAFT_1102895 [Thelephora terrestris]
MNHPNPLDSAKRKSARKSIITPQRKHHKMLKDGTSEVWPEDVEKIFIQGLREYWESPWATFSRGRSRWRNQFLVDYLQKAGVERSRKQVASHIQVLRNMWKGEPEFHLVAGGEELFQENGLLSSGNSHNNDHSPIPGTSRLRPDDRSHSLRHASPSTASSSDSESSPAPGVSHLHVNTDVYSSPSSPTSTSYASPTLLQPSYTPNHFQDVAPTHTNVRLSRLQIWADGLSPFTVEVDSLTSPPKPYSRVMLRLKLSLPAGEADSSFATLHGFGGAIVLSEPWTSSGKCFTRVFTANSCVSKELDYLQPTNQNLTAFLPDSWLTKSRWLEATSRTSITQQIIVDDEVIAFIVYDLDRGEDSMPGPSVELTGFQKYAGNKESQQRSPPPAPPTVSTSSYHSSSHPSSSRYGPISPRESMQPHPQRAYAGV